MKHGDKAKRSMTPELARRMAAIAAAKLPLGSVDVYVPGCGLGNLAFAIAESGFRVYGVDRDDYCIRFCRARHDASVPVHATFDAVDVFRLLPGSLAVDAVACDLSSHPKAEQLHWLEYLVGVRSRVVLAVIDASMLNERETALRVFSRVSLCYIGWLMDGRAIAMTGPRGIVHPEIEWIDPTSAQPHERPSAVDDFRVLPRLPPRDAASPEPTAVEKR